MKKFFTLIACALVAGSAFAQNYKDLGDVITNGGIKRTSTEADLVNFVSAEWLLNAESGEVEKVQGTPRVVVDPTKGYTEEDAPKSVNRCIAVQTRVLEEGASADPWDSRFYITLPLDLAPGDKVTFSMKVMAKEATTISAQGHTDNTGNAYKVYRMKNDFLNNVAVPADDWVEYKVAEFEWDEADEGVNTFALDLGAGGNVFYFDDIKCEVKQVVAPSEVPEPEGYNIFVNRGTDPSVFSVKYFKNYTDAAKSVDGAIAVTSLEPDKTYTEYYMEDGDGNAVDAVLANDWDTQFLIPLPYALNGGDQIKVYFKYKADKAASAGTQAHYAIPAPGAIESKGLGAYPEYAGTYLHYELMGSVSFTTEWKTFNKTVTVPSNAGGMQSICFNLNGLRESNTYYFDDIIVAVDELPTAINTTKAVKATNAIYNVAGQQLKSLQKGLNIVNGEKVYVK